MKKVKVYVVYLMKYNEWGEEFGGEVYGVRTMDQILKLDVPTTICKAENYIHGKLRENREALAKWEKERVEMKTALKKLGPFRNPAFEEQYQRIRYMCKGVAKNIKRYKKISYNDWDMVRTYLYEEEHIEYQEYELEVSDYLLEDKQ